MPVRRDGFTLVEALIAVAIIAILAALLIPVVNLVRERSRGTEARQTLRELQTAFELYRNEDGQRRFPAVAADLSIGSALTDHLEHQRMWARSFRTVDGDGRLLDPWRRWYRYSLAKPAPATGSAELAAWNWDAALGHERAWGSRRDPNQPDKRSDGPLPYPYLWSLGKAGDADDATGWLLCEDGR